MTQVGTVRSRLEGLYSNLRLDRVRERADAEQEEDCGGKGAQDFGIRHCVHLLVTIWGLRVFQ